MIYVRHHGLDLPVYPSDDVLYKKAQYEEVASAGEKPNFVRVVRTSGRKESLKTRLQRADQVFEHIGELCAVGVVEYTWVLCEDTPKIETDRRLIENIVPDGFLLVSEVETIIPITEPIPPESIEAFTAGADQFFSEVAHNLDDEYGDINLEQVVFGVKVTAPQEPPKFWYVDIEPRMGRQEFTMDTSLGFKNATEIYL